MLVGSPELVWVVFAGHLNNARFINNSGSFVRIAPGFHDPNDPTLEPFFFLYFFTKCSSLFPG